MEVADAEMVTEGFTGWVTCRVMGLLVTVTGEAQAELVMTTVICVPWYRLLLFMIKLLLLEPTLVPFTCHWYCGTLPPLTGVAVKVVSVPGQRIAGDWLMVTEGVTRGCTVMVMELLLTEGRLAQDAEPVITRLTTAPLAIVLVVNTELLVPADTPSTFHW